MKVCIDVRLWAETGVGRYIRNLIFNLQEIDDKNTYYLLLLKKDLDTVKLKSNFHKIEADFLWYGLSEQKALPGLLSKIKPDLVHFPHFNVPIFYQGKFIVTIHDLIHQHFTTRGVTTKNPLVFNAKKLGYKLVFANALSKSLKIITPSNFVKSSLVKEWQVNKEKILVTHEGVEEGLLKLANFSTREEFNSLGKKYGVKKPYLFYVGNAQPHKNLERLINSYREVKKEFPNLQLVLSGPSHAFWEKIISSGAPDTVFTGFVTDTELVCLYKNCLAFIMPSLEEGFGIPILEAMSLGCPVVSSNRASLPEVGGDACLYFDPLSIEDMSKQITRVISDPNIRKHLSEKGIDRSKEFSWRRMAEQTLKIYIDSTTLI